MKYNPEQKKEIIKTMRGMIERDDEEGIKNMPEEILSNTGIMGPLIADYPYIIKYVSPKMDDYISHVGAAFVFLSSNDNYGNYFNYYELLSEMPEIVRDDTGVMSVILGKTLKYDEKKLFNTYNIEVLKTISDKAMTKELLTFLYVNSKISDQDIKIAFGGKEILKEFESIKEKLHSAKARLKGSDLSSISLNYVYDFVDKDMTISEVKQNQIFGRLNNLLDLMLPNNTNEYKEKYVDLYQNAMDKDKAINNIVRDILSNPDLKYAHLLLRCFGKSANKDTVLLILPKIKPANINFVLNHISNTILANKDVMSEIIEKTSDHDIISLFSYFKDCSVLTKDAMLKILDRTNSYEAVEIYIDAPEEFKQDEDIVRKVLTIIEPEEALNRDINDLNNFIKEVKFAGEEYLDEEEMFDFSTDKDDNEDRRI